MTTKLAKRRTPPMARRPLFGALMPWREPWLDDLLGDLVSRDENGWFADQMNASMDVTETDQAIEVRMDLPGIAAADVNIDVNENSLTIGGRRKEEYEEGDKRQFHRVERRVGSFSRTVILPAPINRDEAAAEFKNGVLRVTLPKAEEAKAMRIPVKG